VNITLTETGRIMK